jgi:hypothetical protein
MKDYPTGNIENYTKLCLIEADLSHLPLSRLRKYSGEGHFYRCEYEIVLLFGLTELKAMIAWKENVRLLLVFIASTLIHGAVRELNDGVQRLLYMTWKANPNLFSLSCPYRKAMIQISPCLLDFFL